MESTMPVMTDEQIFQWEFAETKKNEPKPGDADFAMFDHYKKLKARYIFEVTNWFQTNNQTAEANGNARRDTSIKQIEDYVNGKLPI